MVLTGSGRTAALCGPGAGQSQLFPREFSAPPDDRSQAVQTETTARLLYSVGHSQSLSAVPLDQAQIPPALCINQQLILQEKRKKRKIQDPLREHEEDLKERQAEPAGIQKLVRCAKATIESEVYKGTPFKALPAGPGVVGTSPTGPFAAQVLWRVGRCCMRGKKIAWRWVYSKRR